MACMMDLGVIYSGDKDERFVVWAQEPVHGLKCGSGGDDIVNDDKEGLGGEPDERELGTYALSRFSSTKIGMEGEPNSVRYLSGHLLSEVVFHVTARRRCDDCGQCGQCGQCGHTEKPGDKLRNIFCKKIRHNRILFNVGKRLSVERRFPEGDE